MNHDIHVMDSTDKTLAVLNREFSNWLRAINCAPTYYFSRNLFLRKSKCLWCKSLW